MVLIKVWIGRLVKLQLTLLLIGSVTAVAQPAVTSAATINNHYYVDLTTSNLSIVSEVQNSLLSLKYHDRFGEDKEVVLKFYDWKQTETARVTVTKSFGLNYYNINLKSIGGSWDNDVTYTCALSDEAGNDHSALFRLTDSVKRKELVLNIFVNPLRVECKDLSKENVVYYYGQISGGKSPYEVTWFIINKYKTNLLYQPREEMIIRPGSTAMITLTDIPDYFVLMKVKDACGNEGQQMVQLVCQDEREKVNTLFVEPLTQPQNMKVIK